MSLPAETCTLNVYDRDGSTLRGSITGHGVSFTDDFGMEGGLAMSASMLEEALADDPSLLREAVVKIATDLGAGETEFAAFLAQIASGTLVGPGEEADRDVTPAGYGLLRLFADWRLSHDTGEFEKKDIGEDGIRYFGFMSSFYDDSEWDAPDGIRWYDDPTARAGFPADMLDIDEDAYWIAAGSDTEESVDENAVNYFRATFTLTDKTQIKMWATADNFFRLWIRAEEIFNAQEDIYNWKSLQEWQGVLDPGTYTVAARVENADTTTGENPIGFLCSIWSLDRHGDKDELILHTDLDNWKAWDATDDPAGLTVADIILQLMDEATDRDLPSMARLSPTFDGVTDTDGTSWPILDERSWAVGTSGADIITDLGDSDVDLKIRPNLDFDAHLHAGEDKSATVALVAGWNLLSYRYDGQPVYGTSAIVKTQAGYAKRTDSAAEAIYDAREDYYESGVAATRAAGRALADRSLEDSARDRISYTAEIIALPAGEGHGSCIPFVDFGPGDTITAYDISMTPAPMVVTAIAGAYPDAAPWRWTIEFEDPGSEDG